MKILFFARRFWPSIGGVEKHCLEIGRELVKRGNEVAVVTEGLRDMGELRDMGKINGIRVYRIPITTEERLKKFQIWRWLWKNRSLIKEADIVHCHDVFFWYLPFRFLYPKKKVFTTFHGWEGVFPPRWQAKAIRKISEKLSFGNICVGDYIKKWYGTRADLVTYGGVAIAKSEERKAKSENLKRKIIFVGRLEKDTGLPIYLKALQILRKEGLEGNMEFAGDGTLRKEAEKYGRVLGFVSEVRDYIKESDFVFTSGYLSILEAMISKKLVFATFDNPLKEDYLKMSPFSKWIVIGEDPSGLANKVKFYFDKPSEEKKMVEETYNWAREQSWEKLAGKYLELWRKTEV